MHYVFPWDIIRQQGLENKAKKEKAFRNKFQKKPSSIPWEKTIVYYRELENIPLSIQRAKCHAWVRKFNLAIHSEVIDTDDVDSERTILNETIQGIDYGYVFLTYSLKCLAETVDDVYTYNAKIHTKCSRLICCKEKLDSIEKLTAFNWLHHAMMLEYSEKEASEIIHNSIQRKSDLDEEETENKNEGSNSTDNQ